jgi:hypothetical protein
MSFLLFPSSGNHVSIDPEWNFTRKDQKVENEHIARSGKRYVYKWGSYYHTTFDLTFVSSSTMAIINSWWQTNTKLMFVDSGGAQIYSVMLIGKELPIGMYQKPYTDLYRGKIELQGY